MIDKTHEQIIALAKQCGAGGYGDRLLAFTPGELQAFAAALTAQQVQPAHKRTLSESDKQLSMAIGIIMEFKQPNAGYRNNSGIDRFVTQVVEYLKDWPDTAQFAQPVQPAAPLGYINRKDIERLSNYKATIWPDGNEIDAVPVYLEPVAQPAQPAEQQSQPTNTAPCEVLRNHGKCWRNACVVAGACTAQLVQPAKQPSQAVMPPISPQAERALKECRDCFVTYDGPTSDANELARYVLELQAAWPQK